MFEFVIYLVQARIQRGGGGTGGPNPPPPLRFVRGGVFYRGLMGRRGVQRLLTNAYTYFHDQCSVWNGHPFSLFPLSK